MKNNTSRALRIHHVKRIQKARSAYWGKEAVVKSARSVCFNGWTPRTKGMVVATAKPCSCYMCGNSRKYFGEPSIQERRAFQEPVAQLLKDF